MLILIQNNPPKDVLRIVRLKMKL